MDTDSEAGTSTTAANPAGREPDAPVIPDMTFPEFVLGQARERRVLAERENAAREEDLTGTVVLISGGGRGPGRLLAPTPASPRASAALLPRPGGELAR